MKRTKNLYRTLAITTAACLLCFSIVQATTAQPGSADRPEGVTRTFGFVAQLSAEGEAFFLGEESLAVIVAPRDRSTVRSDMEFFADPTVDPRVDGTTWIYQDAMHVTTGPPDSTPGVFAWLVTAVTPEPPPVGSFTFTGPDSPTIVDQQIFYRAICDGDCGSSANNGNYRVPTLYADDIFVVVTAVFSR